jgi:hypothetical protein
MKRSRQEAIPRPARPPHILTVTRQEGKAGLRRGPAGYGNLGREQFGMECGGHDAALARSRQDRLLRCPALPKRRRRRTPDASAGDSDTPDRVTPRPRGDGRKHGDAVLTTYSWPLYRGAKPARKGAARRMASDLLCPPLPFASPSLLVRPRPRGHSVLKDLRCGVGDLLVVTIGESLKMLNGSESHL